MRRFGSLACLAIFLALVFLLGMFAGRAIEDPWGDARDQIVEELPW